MAAAPRRTAALRGAYSHADASAAPAARVASADAAEAVESAMRPLVDAALDAAKELEERVPPVHLRALQALEVLGPSHVSSLADAISLLPSTVSRLSDRLAGAGLITRDVSPVNRRATRLEITPAGRGVLTELARARADRLRVVLAAMTERERDHLLSGLGAFAAAAAGRLPPEDTTGTSSP